VVGIGTPADVEVDTVGLGSTSSVGAMMLTSGEEGARGRIDPAELVATAGDSEVDVAEAVVAEIVSVSVSSSMRVVDVVSSSGLVVVVEVKVLVLVLSSSAGGAEVVEVVSAGGADIDVCSLRDEVEIEVEVETEVEVEVEVRVEVEVVVSDVSAGDPSVVVVVVASDPEDEDVSTGGSTGGGVTSDGTADFVDSVGAEVIDSALEVSVASEGSGVSTGGCPSTELEGGTSTSVG
jgi:hypothetical protein